MKKRAVITGIGLVTPLGNSAGDFFRNAMTGVCRIGPVRKFNASAFPVRFGGEVFLSDDENAVLSEKARAEMPRVAQWSVIAAWQAVRDAGIDLDSVDPYGIDIAVGVSISSLDGLHRQYLEGDGLGLASAPPSVPVLMNPSAAAIQISHHLGLHGEVTNITTACSSSASAIGYAARLIEHGESSCVLAGGADEGITRLFLGGFGNCALLSHQNDAPEHASRPFDRRRDGQVFSDAACILVLEEYEHALERGAEPYCELSGFAGSSDAASAFKSIESEGPSAYALEKALARARRNADEIDYHCALAPSDPMLDIRETRMLKRVMGDHARRIAVSSIKSMMGHPLGAAGAVQTATAALAIRNGAVPPTINYSEPDPECDLDYVANQGREMKVRNATVYTLGNGGVNAALVLSAC